MMASIRRVTICAELEGPGEGSPLLEEGAAAGGDPSLTELLNRAFRDGDAGAQARAFELVYPELRRLAHAQMRSLRPGRTLQSTALVHEAFLRLRGVELPFANTRHFFCFAAKTMRRFVVNYARDRSRQKRKPPGERLDVDLDLVLGQYRERKLDPIDLDAALAWLGQVDPELERLVELRHYGGLSADDVARLLDLPRALVERRWRAACGLLAQKLGR